MTITDNTYAAALGRGLALWAGFDPQPQPEPDDDDARYWLTISGAEALGSHYVGFGTHRADPTAIVRWNGHFWVPLP